MKFNIIIIKYMSNSTPLKKIPVQIFYNKKLNEGKGNKNYYKEKDLKNQNNYNSLNEHTYIYPLALYLEPTLFEKYKERLLLSEKPTYKKDLINKNYHHLSFKTHSKSMLLNPDNNNINNDKNRTKNKYKINYNNNINYLNKSKEENNKELNSKNNRTVYNKEKTDKQIKLRKNFSSSMPYRFNNDNNLYQQIYLSEVEKRGFNYNKIKLASMQRKALGKFNKYDNNYFYYNNYNYKPSYILETNKRSYFPQMKKFLINKYLDKNNSNEEKMIKNNKPQGVINIKNNPNFKFHIFHDHKGKEKQLEKPCKRTLKMTIEKIRDLKIMAKINKINDPEIIHMYKSVI